MRKNFTTYEGEEPLNAEEQLYSDEKNFNMNELNDLAKQGYFARQSRGGFSYKQAYE